MSGALLDLALHYIGLGWAPVPVPYKRKGPVIAEWQKLRITETTADFYFNLPQQNIGGILGPASGGLVDVDLDCIEAVALAGAFLPGTAAVFGRTSRRAAHHLYLADLDAITGENVIKFRDPTMGNRKGAMLVEIRIGGGEKGAQTVLPGSTHESGEPITWDRNGVPARVDGGDLRKRVGILAAAALLARYWTEGRRHDAAVALGGVLARCEWEDVDAEILIEAITDYAGDDEAEDRKRAIADAISERRAGRNVTGFPRLKEVLGEPIAKAVCAWLGYNERPEAAQGADLHFEADGTAVTAQNWTKWAQRSADGSPIANLTNCMLILRNVPEVRECFARDEMAGLEMLVAPYPAAVPEAEPFGEPRPMRESDYSAMQEWFQRAGLPRLGRETVYHAVDFRARERSFHPVRDYLGGLTWDAAKRLDVWLAAYLGAEATPYTAAIGRMFLIAMVARIYAPGCKSDYMVVLEGDQGTTKSSVCNVLGGKWFSDSLPDVTEGKDVAQHLVGKWLIEVGELSAMSRAESAQLKQFITRSTERYRPSYGKKEVVQPRQCLFIGTTNKAMYLRDETGGRRFWPVRTGKIDLAALRRDKDQLFAEAVAAYRAGVPWWPDEAFETEHIRPEQEERHDVDVWEDPIRLFLAERVEVLVGEVARGALHLASERIGRVQQNRIVAVLERAGWRRAQKKDRRGNWPWRPLRAAA